MCICCWISEVNLLLKIIKRNIHKNCIQLYLMGVYCRKFWSPCPPPPPGKMLATPLLNALSCSHQPLPSARAARVLLHKGRDLVMLSHGDSNGDPRLWCEGDPIIDGWPVGEGWGTQVKTRTCLSSKCYLVIKLILYAVLLMMLHPRLLWNRREGVPFLCGAFQCGEPAIKHFETGRCLPWIKCLPLPKPICFPFLIITLLLLEFL